MIDEQGYRLNVGIVLINHEQQVLLARRVGQQAWQFPQGGIQMGESSEVAMLRELFEEVGLGAEDIQVLAETEGWLQYDLPKKFWRKHKLPLCIGQKQKWFLLRLQSSDAAINLNRSKTPEFDAFRWVQYYVPIEKVIYFKREVYQQALDQLASLANLPICKPL